MLILESRIFPPKSYLRLSLSPMWLRYVHLSWQILVPVPQYPLYSAAISLFGGSLVPYYLEEEANWGLDLVSTRQSVAAARSKGITVRVSLIIKELACIFRHVFYTQYKY